ncbi:MAG: hypothetical protein ABJN40_04855 [Sneathiella sp.]
MQAKFDRLRPVFQRDITGCAIASTAWIAGEEYAAVKRGAEEIGVDILKPSLWSDVAPMRQLLQRFDISVGAREIPFQSWGALPDQALLAVKWHLEQGRPHWHWSVFSRQEGGAFVMDPKKALKTNIRTDFGRIKPKWYIELLAE